MDEFVKMFGRNYSPGQHVTMLGPTQKGKTTLVSVFTSSIASQTPETGTVNPLPPERDGQ